MEHAAEGLYNRIFGLGNSSESLTLSLEVAVFSQILQRFMQRSPVPVMVQALLERVLSPQKLNAWFEGTAVEQYTRDLLFSTVFELMSLVVFKTFPSVHAAYQENAEQVGVSIAFCLQQTQWLGGKHLGRIGARYRARESRPHRGIGGGP